MTQLHSEMKYEATFADIKKYFEYLNDLKMSINIATLVAHAARLCVMMCWRAASPM